MPTEPGGAVLELDPGLASGTGAHATTAMCLEWLDGCPLCALRVLDYGCGSAILALAALKLGARSACACDIDPQALTATCDNARRNGLEDQLEILIGPAVPTGRQAAAGGPARCAGGGSGACPPSVL
ncbi:MAG TPA: 50S ribosomal protein L11 methyltransferase [Steroidobacteraceae bacterium]|nr:50S ribosomal protein L11 methyltransferase [Steroidobacteraceae bacterium]